MAERIDEIEHGSNEGDALDPVPPGRRERVRRDTATHLANAVAGEGIDIVQLLHGAGDADAVEEEKENDSTGEEREDAAGDAVNRPVEPAIGIEDRFEDNAENDAADDVDEKSEPGRDTGGDLPGQLDIKKGFRQIGQQVEPRVKDDEGKSGRESRGEDLHDPVFHRGEKDDDDKEQPDEDTGKITETAHRPPPPPVSPQRARWRSM